MNSPAPFVHDIRVTWGDCDPARIAYTARIPAWALEAINAWWEMLLGEGGWFHMELDLNLGTPFVRMEMDFRHPITPRHVLRCHVQPIRLGTKSVTFSVTGTQNDSLCFEGRFTEVFTIADRFVSQPAPPDVRRKIEAFLPVGSIESSE